MNLYEKILRIIFTSRCISCGKTIETEKDFCQHCSDLIKDAVVGNLVCKNCGKPKNSCICKQRTFAFDKITSPFIYDGVIKNSILRLKTQNDSQPLNFLTSQMTDDIRKNLNTSFDFVTCVPMTQKETTRRTENQSELLAKRVAKNLSLPFYKDALKKVFDTKPQHSLPMFMRNGNSFGVFDADKYLVNGKDVLLIDDIITTGNTLNECAKMLKLAGAKSVKCAAVATTVIKDSDKREDYENE